MIAIFTNRNTDTTNMVNNTDVTTRTTTMEKNKSANEVAESNPHSVYNIR